VLFGSYITEQRAVFIFRAKKKKKRKQSMEKVVVEHSRRIGGWSCGRIDRWYWEGEISEERAIIKVKS
jgi:hypothetical protein